MEKKEAMEILKDFHDKSALFSVRTALETLIPEFAESEDERIKKELLEYLKGFIPHHDLDLVRKSKVWIAWLEKQCESVSITDEWIEDYWHHEKVNNPYSYDKGDEIQFDHQGFVSFCKKYCKKPTDEEMKTSEMQKPADKAEQKFKVGDWVISPGGCYLHILDIKKDGYLCKDILGEEVKVLCEHSNSDFKLWTIQDARDGDVLGCESGWTCIFKTLVNDETFSSYCFMDATKWFCETGGECHTLKEEFVKAYDGKIYPATKEQRDQLFSKMKEAGYEWDAEKKELKKIEQKPADSDWVNLGLPSGTLWKSSNETDPNDDKHDFYTYDEAMQKFGLQLPTKEQWEELKENCQWTWNDNGYKVTGPNGESIFLRAAGYRGFGGEVYDVGSYGEYWSSRTHTSIYAYSCEFSCSAIGIYSNNRCLGQSVRLVK